MGRGSFLKKNTTGRHKYRVGDVLQGFNDGVGVYCLYRNVTQPALITKLPLYPGGEYRGVIIGFENGEGHWDETALHDVSEYEYAPKYLKRGDHIEFTADRRVDADGDEIDDVPGTWISGTVEAVITTKKGNAGLPKYRIAHPNWDFDSDSQCFNTTAVPLNKTRRLGL
jgi:hypothetical protein